MNRKLKTATSSFVLACCFTFLCMWQPSPKIEAQRSNDNSNLPVIIDKKTSADVKQQDEKKHALFQQALTNQDTVMLLISKKTKPRVVHVYKRIPVIIPITASNLDYVVHSVTEIDTTKHEITATVTLDTTSTIVIKKTKKKGWFYRLFHKN